jgi:hypothetical protein
VRGHLRINCPTAPPKDKGKSQSSQTPWRQRNVRKTEVEIDEEEEQTIVDDSEEGPAIRFLSTKKDF